MRQLVFATLLTLGIASPASAALPPTLSYFCQASVKGSNVFYVTQIFTATAQTSDVTKAWRTHVAGIDAKAKSAAICQGGVDVESLEGLRKLTTESAPASVVNVDWSFAP